MESELVYLGLAFLFVLVGAIRGKRRPLALITLTLTGLAIVVGANVNASDDSVLLVVSMLSTSMLLASIYFLFLGVDIWKDHFRQINTKHQ